MEGAGSSGRTGTGSKEEVSPSMSVTGWSAELHLECMELSLGMEEQSTKNLWVRIKGRAETGDSGDLLQVAQPGRLEWMKPSIDKRSPRFTRPGLHGRLQPPRICWRGNTAGHKQFRRFLECVDNFSRKPAASWAS